MSFEWKETTLGAVCKFVQYGYTTKAKDTRNGIGFIRGTDISKNSVNWGTVPDCEVSPDNLEKYLVKNGDILITRMGTIGTTALVEKIARPSVFASYLIRHVVDTALAIPAYVGYVLKSELFSRFISTHGGAGAVQPNINAKTLSEFTFPLPPLSHQRNIAQVLGAIDNRITHLNETNATLEAIAQALFKSWFVDFDPVRAKTEGKLPEGMDEATAALFPDAFEMTEFGVVPKGWKNSNLSNVSDVGIGKTPPRKEAQWFSEDSSDVRWVSIRDMGTSGAYISNTSEFLTADAIDKFNVRRVPSNTVLLSFKMTIGRVAISDGEMTTNEAIAHCKLTSDSPLPSEYIYLHLKGFDYSSLSSTSSIADAVNSKTVKAIPILVPSAEVVASFKKLTGVLFEKIKNTHYQSQTLITMRDTLLPRLISGQLRIADAQAEIEKVTA